MTTALLMFLFFVGITLVITYWAARRSSGASAFFAANRQIKGWQNGFAVAGDYMSAASFLGIAGIIAFQGYDGFMYSVGWLVAYLTVLLIVAEPLRNAGKYTMADVLAYRLKARPVRAMASLSTLTVSIFYMIAQMVGAGALVALLLKDSGISFQTAVIGVGILMIVYVVFGGMLATTWVQIIKAILLMSGTILLSILVLAHFGFSFGNFFAAIGSVTYHDKGVAVTKDFLQPGLRFKPPYGALDLISLGMALIFGTWVKCSRASCTSISKTSSMLLPLKRTCNVSRLNRRPSHTGQVTQTSARKSISRRLEPLPSQASQRPPGLLKLKRPGV